MAFSRVEAALDSIGLRAQYLQDFIDDDMDDEAVEECLADPALAMSLNGILPSGGHRIKFQKAFKNIPVGSSSPQNNTSTDSIFLPLFNDGHVQNKTDNDLRLSCAASSSTLAIAGLSLEELELSSSSSGSEEELIDLNVAQPVQIMDFKESKKRGSPSEIVFYQNRLQEILNKTKSKKVAVLAIAGPSRKGKSFFLNFVLRYLNSLETGEKDWMGWRQPNKGLDGFTWRNCAERVTTGIWMWSEPFTMKSKNDDFDLLIMDTQGVFDEHTTQREWSILVGLGLLTSSCLIFNIMSDLQEDYLQVFENFLSFGLMAMNEKNGRTPFQKLVFLIRDWNIPGQYPYGLTGGKKFIGNKLDAKSHHKESHKRVRQQLKDCFEDIACFLLPHPGESVLAMDFDGSATKSETFAAEIEKCIMELVNPSKIPLKKLNGNFLTGQDILSIFQLYCELFNSDEIPNPESVFEITAKSCNTVVIKKCVDAFSKELLAHLENRPFFLKEDLEKQRTPAQVTCFETFDKARKMGDDNIIKQAREELLEQTESSFETVKQKNAQKFEKVISQATADSIKEFQKLMQQHLQSGFVSTSKLENLFELNENEVLNTFLTSCGIRDRMVFQEPVKTLLLSLESEKSAFRNNNLLLKREAEKELQEDIEDMVTNYCDSLDSRTENRIILEEELEEIHTSEMKRVLGKFEELELQEELIEDGEAFLRKKIEVEFSRIKKAVLSFNEKIQLQGKSLVSQAIAEYTTSMKAKLTFNTEDFLEYHEQALISCQEFLSSSFAIEDTKLLGELQDELEAMVDKAYYEFQLILGQKENELKSEMMLAKDNAAKLYSVSMQNLFPLDDNAPVEQSNLERTHEDAKSEALQLVKNSFENASAACPGADEQWLEDTIVELESDIDQKYQTFIGLNKLRKDNQDTKAQVFLAEVKDYYGKKMKEALEVITDEDELKDLQFTIRQESIDNLIQHVQPMVSKTEVLDQLLNDLKAYIETEFEGSLELFRMKKDEDEYAVKTALLDARVYYNEEMDKHFQAKDWLEVEELRRLHQEIGEAAIDKGKQEVDLTSSQENQLRELMLTMYKAYEDKNLLRKPTDSYAIGIDLGTTYSCVAVCVKGKVKVIPCDDKTTIPSYVAFNDDHSISVGETAKEQAFRRPESTIFDAKRLIGRKFNEDIVKKDMELWPFQVVGEDDQPKIKIPNHQRTYRPEEISARVLSQLKKLAEEYLNKKVTNAVVTVPAYFNDSQRQATKDAAEIAGLSAKILNEPTAAAIAYELDRSDDLKRNVLIFDLGGGTFDVAVLQMKGGKIVVKAIGGDTHLGGEDFDNEMVKHVIDVVKRKTGRDLGRGKNSSNPEEKRSAAERLRRIRSVCEKQKRNLSTSSSVMITIDRIDETYDLNQPFTRKEFEDLNMEKFKKSIEIMAGVISDAKMSKGEIEDIVLIGGSTRIPKIREMLIEFFDGKALNSTVNADEAVAFGAAIHAALEYGKSDEVSKCISVSDVAPLSIGIEVFSRELNVIIPKNTPVPCSKTKDYYTVTDYQTSIDVKIFEGEEKMARDNNLLGEFNLSGIPSARAGAEPLDVTMTIDGEGILHVKAVCRSTGGSNDIKIEAHKGRMSGNEISSAKGGTQCFNW